MERGAATPRLSIDKMLSMAEQFWAEFVYIQHLHPDREQFLERVRLHYLREELERKSAGRELDSPEQKAKSA